MHITQMRGVVVRARCFEVGMRSRLPIAIGVALVCATLHARVRAYADPNLYADSVMNGGGGGRWFTGSSADGYGCDVCHTGRAGPDLAISGLPIGGFIPGAHYEVAVGWPLGAQLALVAEFTDEQKQGAGTITARDADALELYERCSIEEGEGAPPFALYDAEGGRKLFTIIDCGAQSTRFRWTAPIAVNGPVWFNLGFVAADEDASPAGDGVTLVETSLQAVGATMEPRVVAQGCDAIAAGARGRAGWWMLGVLGIAWRTCVRSSRKVV
jgi:hypothetical protein